MHLCLNMIVRNEADRIVRCLNSVAPYITSFAIVDTGSTDNTRDLILDFFAERKIPGVLKVATFENFEQARNLALKVARESEFWWDFAILMDADMELIVNDPLEFTRLDPNAPSYDMEQRAGSLRYLNKRLINRSATGWYIGATHEYLDVPAYGRLTEAFFIDHADGSNRKDKYERDIKLLLGSLEKEPENPRTWFYLAQSYRDAGQHQHALDAYQKRIDIGGWDEEIWFSQLSIAHCWMALKVPDNFVLALLKAHQMRPSRAEAMHTLAAHFRNTNQQHLGTVFAEAGMAIPLSQDALFVQEYAYTTGCKEEFAICAFYQPIKREAGFRACDELSLDRKGTPHSREQARQNLFHYMKPLKELAPSFKPKPIQFIPDDGYVPMNPSIAADPHGRLSCVVRTVNYNITPDGRYEIRAGDGSIAVDNPIDTRNYLIDFNEDLTIKRVAPIRTPLPPPEFDLVRGYEDMRLFAMDDGWHVSATVRETNAHGWCEIHTARLKYNEERNDFAAVDAKMISPDRPDRQHEKNWAPFVRRDKLEWLYRLGHIVDLDGKFVSRHVPPLDAGHISGGSQVVPWPECWAPWMTLVHEARVHPATGQRFYQHRFVALRDEGEVAAISRPFVFHAKQIEFAAGLAWKGSDLVMSYGVRDREAWIATISAADVKNLFWEPIS